MLKIQQNVCFLILDFVYLQQLNQRKQPKLNNQRGQRGKEDKDGKDGNNATVYGLKANITQTYPNPNYSQTESETNSK